MISGICVRIRYPIARSSALSKNFPEADERAMGYLIRTQIPLIMMPCDGDCGFGTDSKFALAAWWLGKAIDGEERTQDLKTCVTWLLSGRQR